jgi:hypothetical protein
VALGAADVANLNDGIGLHCPNLPKILTNIKRSFKSLGDRIYPFHAHQMKKEPSAFIDGSKKTLVKGNMSMSDRKSDSTSHTLHPTTITRPPARTRSKRIHRSRTILEDSVVIPFHDLLSCRLVIAAEGVLRASHKKPPQPPQTTWPSATHMGSDLSI